MSPGQGTDLSDSRRGAVVHEPHNYPVLLGQVPDLTLSDPVRRAAAAVCEIFAPPRPEHSSARPSLRPYSRVDLGQHPLGTFCGSCTWKFTGGARRWKEEDGTGGGGGRAVLVGGESEYVEK